MKAQEYLISVLKSWVKKFPGIHVNYAYDNSSEYHIIEITPKKIYESPEYQKAELKLWIDFSERFLENLLISDPDEANDMSNSIFKK